MAALRKLGVDGQEVRLPEHLKGMDGLIIPGGESTTLGRLMSIYHLREPIEQMARQGKSIWGTCAGMIMMAHEITEEDPVPLQLVDIGVHRNAFGRQVDSFEQDIEIAGFDHVPFHGIFIRSPVINRVGRDVKVLAALSEDQPVAVRQGCMLATAFHPELTNDTRFHRLFLDLVSTESRPSA